MSNEVPATPPEMKRELGYRYMRFWIYWLTFKTFSSQKFKVDKAVIKKSKSICEHVLAAAVERKLISQEEVPAVDNELR